MINRDLKDGMLKLSLNGDLLASNVEELRAQVKPDLEAELESVVLDLSETKKIDSLGISFVVGLYKSCQDKEMSFAVTGANDSLISVFKLFKLTNYFPINAE